MSGYTKFNKIWVFRLEHINAQGHECVVLTEIASSNGVGVITKLCFIIFAEFKESMTLNLAQRSFKVIHFGGNRKPVYDFI